MSGNFFKLLFLYVAFLFCSIGFSQQKKFKVLVKWPSGLQTENMQLYVNNGTKTDAISLDVTKSEIEVSDIFISRYATISILIGDNNCNLPGYSQFYISEEPAMIVFNTTPRDSANSSKAAYETVNAYDVAEVKRLYASYLGGLESEGEMYLQENGMDSIYFSIQRKLILKKLEFIKQNSDSYYAFKLFQSEIVPFQFPNKDDLVDSFLDFYRATFTDEIFNSVEGSEVEKILQSKWVASHDSILAPAFRSIDMEGNEVIFENLKGNYILINFWATWCGPCMAEMPAIKKINDKYKDKGLVTISLSFDKNVEIFKAAIEKYEMDWINIFQDDKFSSDYGGKAALPRLFLIDREGMIIYNRSAGKESDFVNLAVLNTLLESHLGN